MVKVGSILRFGSIYQKVPLKVFLLLPDAGNHPNARQPPCHRNLRDHRGGAAKESVRFRAIKEYPSGSLALRDRAAS